MHQDAPRLAAFSPIDDSITGRGWAVRLQRSDRVYRNGCAILGLDEV